MTNTVTIIVTSVAAINAVTTATTANQFAFDAGYISIGINASQGPNAKIKKIAQGDHVAAKPSLCEVNSEVVSNFE